MGYLSSLSLLEMSKSDFTAYFHPRTQYKPPTTSGRYPTHPGPILTSQLLLEGDLGPETCQNRLSRAILRPPRKTYLLLLSKSTLDPDMMSI